MSTIRIDFIITCLGAGGAEQMLLKLNRRLDRKLFSPRVIALTDYQHTSADLEGAFVACGVPVVNLGMQRGIPGPAVLARLVAAIRGRKPHVVQTWMYHADLLGGIGTRLSGRAPLIWNLRNSDLDPATSKRSTRMVARLCAKLSRLLPQKIVTCSRTAGLIHAGLGYDPGRMVFIPNGFDLDIFAPDPAARQRLCAAEEIAEGALIVGYAARFDAQKDHLGFLQAAARLKESCPEAVFVLCGDNIDWQNRQLCAWIDGLRLAAHVRLLGRRLDMPAVTAAFDIATSASAYGEAFSNAIGEAMSCGVPCVVTDVGDSAQIVGDTGRTVPIRTPEALAAAWGELAGLGRGGRADLGARARLKIAREYSLEKVTALYESLYLEIAAADGIRAARS